MVCLILTILTSEDWLDELNFGPDENGPATVEAVEDDDFFEEYFMAKISEFDCLGSDDPKGSDCFTSDDDADSICFSHSGYEDCWAEVFVIVITNWFKSAKWKKLIHLMLQNANASREDERSKVWRISDTDHSVHSVEANTAYCSQWQE